MQTKYICVWIKGEMGALLNWFRSSSKIFYWLFQGGTSFVDFLCFCSVLCLLCLCARLFNCALWSPAGKGLTSWLSFVVSNCEFVTFPLVSWVGCGTWLYWFLIFAPLHTFTNMYSIDEYKKLSLLFYLKCFVLYELMHRLPPSFTEEQMLFWCSSAWRFKIFLDCVLTTTESRAKI